MDDLFPIIMFIVFFLAPLLEGLKRKNKEKNAPPPEPGRPLPRAPQQRLPQQRQDPTPSRMEEVSAKTRDEETAAGMVPDDLWEILTGQKRPPVLTTPQPLPLPRQARKPDRDVAYDADEDEEAATGTEAVVRDQTAVQTRRARGEAKSLETLERHAQPVVVSLEENLPTAAQRHAAFHKKITAPATVTTQPKRPHLLDFSNRAEVQRAFLLHEILGKPKGLE
jgi:hypothetical protein